MHRVLIAPATYESCLQAVNKVFEHFPLELSGKRVLIKPNVLRAAAAEEGITTHPAVVRAVVEKVAAAGPAVIVVGDTPVPCSTVPMKQALRKQASSRRLGLITKT